MMTPGLRDFVLEAPAADHKNVARKSSNRSKNHGTSERRGDGQSQAPDLLPTALAALAPTFTVVGDPGAPGSGARRRTWLDTFDWRLYRAGLVLEVEQARRGGRLLLTKPAGTPPPPGTPPPVSIPQAEQPVTGWPPRRPPTDLPPGPVRDQIASLISPRALLTVVRTVSTVSAMRLLNADGKTVARLIVDRATATAAGTSAELALRLAVIEVRGYPAQARKAASLLADVPGAFPARQPLFIAALTALGRHPADDTNGQTGPITGPITGQLPASAAVATVLLRLLDTLELNVDGVLRDIDTEFLHDLRVAVRRTRSAIKLLGAVLPAELGRRYAAEFRWLGDMTTPTRDLDVHLLGFDAMAEQLQAASPADLEPFRAFLAGRRTREFRRLAAVLRSPRFLTLTADWRKALLEILDASAPGKRRQDRQSRQARPGRPRREPDAATLAIGTTGRAFRRIATQGAAITPDSAPESLHDLRKRCKELRYLLEFFVPLHDPVAYRKVVGDLKQLQDCLGDFQDSQVQREEIGALADAMLAEHVASAATLLAMGEVAARLAVSQAQARADFARRFARFAGPAAQQRIRTLLAEPPAPAEAPVLAKTPAPPETRVPAEVTKGGQ